MLTSSLTRTLRDIRDGQPVSEEVKRALDCIHPTVPTSQRFEFSKSILDLILQKPTGPPALYFTPAIACLRSLAPCLKAGDASPIDVIVRVEKYTVKFALLTCDSKDYIDIRRCTLHELENTLRLTFEARNAITSSALSSTKHSSRRKGRSYNDRSKQLLDYKENNDPQVRSSSSKSRRASGRLQPNEVSYILDNNIFSGASELLSDALLPHKDSSLVTRIIAGSLTIRLTSDLLNVAFGERIYLFKAVVIPWIRHLQSFPEPSNREYSTCFVDRICRYLQDTSSDDCQLTKMRARFLALSIRDSTTEVFAYGLHKAALKLIASNEQGLMQQETLDVVVSIYEDVLQHFSTFSSAEVNWSCENLSVWLDHVIHVWSRINAKTLPVIFSNRLIIAGSKKDIQPELVQCFQIQSDLFNLGAYSRKSFQTSNFSNISNSPDKVWKKVEKLILTVQIPDLFVNRTRWSPDKNDIIADELSDKLSIYVRFLHVIEPLRLMLLNQSQSTSSIMHTKKVLLRRHVSTTYAGLQLMASPVFEKCGFSDVEKKRLVVRMNRMAGGALEASKDLIQIYWKQREPEMFCNVITCVAQILQSYSTWYEEYVLQWWEWLLTWLKPFFEKVRKSIETANQSSREDDESILKMLLAHCDDIIETHCKEWDVSECQKDLLRTLRKVFVSQGDWYGAFDISRRILSSDLKRKGFKTFELSEAAFPFLQDLVRAITTQSNDGTYFNDFEYAIDENLNPELLLGLILEYQCYARSNTSSFQFREGFLETLFGLQRARYFLFQQVPNSNQCILRKLHQLWMLFVIDGEKCWTSKAGKQLDQHFSKETDIQCNGHIIISDFNFREGLSICSSSHTPQLATIYEIWKLTDEEKFQELGDTFHEFEQLKEISPLESCSREYLLLAAEILDWASFALALRDYDFHALRSRTLAEECREAVGIPRSDNSFLRDLCARLASSVLCDWYVTVRGQNDWSAELKRVRLKFAESNFPDVLNMSNDVENELQPYEKALAHEFGSGNIIAALVHSHKALKGIVRRMAQANRGTTILSKEQLQSQFNIGGATINMDVNFRIESGQELMRDLVELINTLFQHARLYFEAESINNGQYYMERCYTLASTCLPQGNYTLASVTAAYHAKSVGKDTIVPKSILKDTVNALEEKCLLIEHDRNVVSEHEMWNHLTVCRYRHKGYTSNLDIIRACDICENAVKSKKVESDDWARRAGIELSVLKGIAFSNSGESEKAVSLMKPLLKRFPALRVNIRVFAHYHMARSMHRLQEQSNEITTTTKTPKKRITRSTRSKAVAKSFTNKVLISSKKMMDDVIDETIQQITIDFNVPWICRRIYGLQSLKFGNGSQRNCSTNVSLLAKKIGASFNVRWRFAMKCKMELLLKQGGNPAQVENRLQQLEELFSSMSIGELERLIELLRENHCTIVGIDVDDLKENLIVWRICRDGTFLEKKPLPQIGPTSVTGILERINDVVTVKHEVPEPREKLTNKKKSEWWADRFRLDDELGKIVSDIETKWLGDCGYFMDPENYNESNENNENDEDEQVILLVGTELERIPWETVGILRERVISVTRSPSLAFIEHSLLGRFTIEQNDLFYLVNPTGEFKKTENRFREVIQTQSGWTGFCGKCTREDVSNAYNGQRIYVYCGHGTGLAFIAPRRFEKLEDAPVTLMMGCSSAKPNNLNVDDEESNGVAIDFLICGAPAVVGTLWDVSDGEIDRFTLSLLALWTGAESASHEPEFVSLAEAVARSRSACRTPYLVGAACIVIGSPNIFVRRKSSNIDPSVTYLLLSQGMDKQTKLILLSMIAAGAGGIAIYMYKNRETKLNANAIKIQIEKIHTEWLSTMADKYTSGDFDKVLQLLINHCISTSKNENEYKTADKIFKEIRCTTCGGNKQKMDISVMVPTEDQLYITDEINSKYEIEGGIDKVIRVMCDYAINDESVDVNAIFSS